MKTFYSVAASSAIALFGLASGLQAQTVETGTNVAVFARQPNAAAFKYVKAATRVRLPFTGSAPLRQSIATTFVNLVRNANTATVTMQEAGSCQSANSSAGTSASDNPQTFKPGSHDMLVRYPARMGAKFLVVATLKGKLTGNAVASGGVDIDNNGRLDWSAKVTTTPASMRWQLTAGASGLAIRLRTEALAQTGASGSSAYNTTLEIAITPATGSGTRCTFSRVGAGCGPVLTPREIVNPTGNVLTFATANATPGGAALFVLGARAIKVQFPGTRCFLYTPPLIIFGRVVSARGTASIRFDIPKTFEGKFLSQDVILFRTRTGLGVQSTNGVGVVCRKG